MLALVAGAAVAVAGILFRPLRIHEAWWTCAGALIVVLGGDATFASTVGAVLRGSDVYFFLAGMMLLAEIARRDGLFDWLAACAVRASHSSPPKLFALVYVVGVGVTALLSNDATAVVLTPAVLAAVKRARLEPLPFAYACAFVANAASFVLPISNPANLVLYGQTLPPLGAWFAHFALASAVAIGLTFAAMRLLFARQLRAREEREPRSDETHELTADARFASIAIALSALAIVALSLGGRYLGLGTFACAAFVFAASLVRDRGSIAVLRGVQWSIVPMVAGLFAIVDAVERSGALAPLRTLLAAHAHADATASLAAVAATTALCNVVNNLPVGLLAASALGHGQGGSLRDAIVIAVDLGPNLSVTGSLATVLWLAALRREGIAASPMQFLRNGAIVALPALGACALVASASRY